MPADLLADTLRMIRASDEEIAAIARACGVSKRWLYKVVSGVIPNPGVLMVQRVHNYLAPRQPDLVQLTDRQSQRAASA